MIADLDLKQRFARLKKLMEREGYHSLIAYSNALKPDNVFYLTGYNLYAGEAWAYMGQDGAVSLWFTEDWDAERAKKQSWAQNIQLLTSGELPQLPVERTCLAGIELVPQKYDTLLRDFLGTARDGNAILMEAALVRTPVELDYLRTIANIADQGFMRAVEVLRPGMTELDLLAEIEYTMRHMGATDNFQLMASGTDNQGMVVGREKLLVNGERILFEITPALDSVTYSAQLCRTICLGGASDVIRQKYAILKEAMETALAAIRPGVTFSEIFELQNQIFVREGYGDYCKPPYMRTRGHGFGLTQPFNVDAENHMTFEEGMVMVIHPNQYIPETGYLALGEMILVTATGCKSLSAISHDLVEK